MVKKSIYLIIFLITIFLINGSFCYAESYKGKVTGTEVNLRKGPGTNYGIITSLEYNKVYAMVTNTIYKTEGGCKNGWYNIYYSGTNNGYVCSDYLEVYLLDEPINDIYDRPWTSPKKAIVGGAKFISSTYISQGQFTSYLKKFNVNPNGSYAVYNHQYMANLQAPSSEASSTYKSYSENGLLLLPLEFTIPIFLDMPDVTNLPGVSKVNECQSEVTDTEFERMLDAEGFPETYKCKLRMIHKTYSNWSFKAMHTNLNFGKSVIAEQSLSSIQGGDIYYDFSNGYKIETESGWFVANYDTVAYYLDPRNFLNPEKILMFESLSYSGNYTEVVVDSILENTFMKGVSLLDNQTFSSIFVEAGVTGNMSAVYLASLAKQESGVEGGVATTGEEFTYQGITYKGLYNFFNIGANSGAESPVHAGLVWAAGGDITNITNPSTPTTPNTTGIQESTVLTNLSSTVSNGCLIGLSMQTKLIDIKNKLSGLTVTINGSNDSSVIKTGDEITITDGTSTFKYTIVVKGDVDGDGDLSATDYVKIKNYIMERVGSNLNVSQSLAADVDNNGEIGATDYVKIKNKLME